MNRHLKTLYFTIIQTKDIFLQYRFAKKALKGLIPTSTEKRLKTKIEIYATLVPLLTGYRYSNLLDVKLTKNSKKLITIISALMPVNDEIVDNLDYDKSYIDHIFKNFSTARPKTQHERIQQIALLKILEIADHSTIIFEALKRVHIAQLESMKQKHSKDIEEVAKITREKGGATALLFLKAVSPKVDKDIMDAIYQFGNWMQLVDDMLDKHENKEEGINTLATSLPASEFLDILEQNANKLKDMIKSLDLVRDKKENFLFSCHYFIEITIAFFTDPNRDDHNYQTGLTRVLHHISYIRSAYPNILNFKY